MTKTAKHKLKQTLLTAIAGSMALVFAFVYAAAPSLHAADRPARSSGSLYSGASLRFERDGERFISEHVVKLDKKQKNGFAKKSMAVDRRRSAYICRKHLTVPGVYSFHPSPFGSAIDHLRTIVLLT